MIIKHRIPLHSELWYKFRTIGLTEKDMTSLGTQQKVYAGGTGASEIGHLMGLCPYSPTEMALYYYKVGYEVPDKIDNEKMFHGRNMESYIRRLWECYDPNGLFMTNYEAWESAPENNVNPSDYLYRKAQRINAYITNPDYPYLFCSLDFASKDHIPLISSAKHGFYKGEPLKSFFPIECKTIGEWAASQWETNIPDQYIAQINVQMLLTESTYAELAILIGGNQFRVIPIERNDELCNMILEYNTQFWEKRVLPGRECFLGMQQALLLGDNAMAEQFEAKIHQFAPEPDDNPAYKQEFSKRHRPEKESMTVEDNKYKDIARQRMKLAKAEKELSRQRQELENQLMELFVNNKVEYLDFGEGGRVRYFKKENGKNFQLDFNKFKHERET